MAPRFRRSRLVLDFRADPEARIDTTDRLCAVSVPAFDPVTGLLPEGEHDVTWDEIRDRFGWNLVRRRLLDGLGEGFLCWQGLVVVACG